MDRTFSFSPETLSPGERLAIESKQDSIIAELQSLVALTATPTGLVSGQKNVSTAGTAEALGSSIEILAIGITAHRTNTGYIYIGGSGVDSTNGWVLVRDGTRVLAIDDLSKIYIDASVSGEGVSFLYLTA